MEDTKETPPPLVDQLKEYAETRIKLAKYQAMAFLHFLVQPK